MTEAQSRVYLAVRKIGADGWPVAIREVMAETGYLSTATVHEHLVDLISGGWIESNPRRGGNAAGFRILREV